MSKSLFERTKFKLGCNASDDKTELELITDPDMYVFFEKGTRSGISYISNRLYKVNNKYISINKKTRNI